ncbi:phospholipase A and acyltransferase 4-like [Sparus aurata]|uniref:phospholipase A and acyltransferase 4-like n=1 Tax=Sparus aurata TaxID=8175 RepID=UPI0011C16B89|nr:phospholipase A and acyltransferase 4-like [Sparus aurata]
MGQSESNQKPEPGDLIEVFRVGYQHWAVYIGDGLVVHLVPPSEVAGAGASSVMSVAAQRAVGKKEKLSDVVGNDDWKVNNDLDEKYEPHQTDIIVKEALQLVGKKKPYDIVAWNCEHFAKKLRYGKAESRQVRKAGEAAMVAGVATVVILGIVALFRALFRALFGRSKKKETVTVTRSD